IAVRPGALVVSLRQARSALPASRLQGKHMHAEDIASSRVLLNTVGAQPLQAYVDAVLGPPDATDRSGELLRGLTAFLEHNGHWGSAATALRVHRHTMRNRIEAIERLTGRRMDSARTATSCGWHCGPATPPGCRLAKKSPGRRSPAALRLARGGQGPTRLRAGRGARKPCPRADAARWRDRCASPQGSDRHSPD